MNPKGLKSFSRGIALLLVMALFSSAALPAFAAPGDITLVSVDSNGVQSNSYSARPAISPDGRFVVFESAAPNWQIAGTGGLFIRDLQTGQTTRVGADGEDAVVSSGGRFVAFTAFIPGGTVDMYDVFVRDLQLGVTTQVSVDSSGVPGNDWSDGPAISDDGRFIAFRSDATNLVSSDTNAAGDIFVRDLQTGVTERISLASDGTQASASSSDPSISADGRAVVFSSSATNLVSGDTNGKPDIFVRDRLTGTTTRVSVNSSGVEADKGASEASVSGDGRYVSFSSTSGNLISGDSLGFEYVYVHDRQTGTTALASIFSDGYPMYGTSEQSVISADGRYVAFQYDDRGDGMAVFVIYAHDLLTGMTTSVVGNHSSGDDWSGLPSISADGRFIAFVSGEILVSGDTNGVSDMYLKEMSYQPDPSPTVSSVQPTCSGRCTYPSPDTITFRMTFSEVVTGVGTDDFTITMSGGVSGAGVTDVRVSGSGNEYIVTVSTGTGDGTLRLDVLDNDSIQDIGLNPLGGPGGGNGNFNTGELYTVDKNIPAVTSIVRTDPSPTAADTIHYAVTFSEPVTGVDGSDFTLWPSGNITAFMLTQLEGSGANYTVTINTGTGDGTLRLGIGEDDTIIDAVGNPLGGPGIGNGNFEGETYTVNKNAPFVVSSVRQDPNPTSADVVHFTVIFSEPVTGVDQADFLVTAFGISGTSILTVNGDGISFWIDVATGTGNGDLRLDVMDNDSILDLVGLPLGGPGLGNGNFITGEAYTITRAVPPPPNLLMETFRSNGTNDGWVLESSEDSNQGGSKNATATTFRLGDDAQDRQYRAILHFPTYYLPDNAVIIEAILMIKAQGLVGTDPFTTHQNVLIDIRDGPFGSFGPFGINALQLTDFQDVASGYSVGTIQNNPVSGWYWTLLNSTAFPHINVNGVTQFRLGFQLDDNDDQGDDYLSFFSGNHEAQSDRPHLLVKYYLQK